MQSGECLRITTSRYAESYLLITPWVLNVISGKVLLSEIIAASLQLSEYAAHEIIEVKQGGG